MPSNLLEIYGDKYESTTVSFFQHYLTIVLQIQQPKTIHVYFLTV